MSAMRSYILAFLLCSMACTTACTRKAMDVFVVRRVVDRGARVPDVAMACSMGQALSSAIAGSAKLSSPPRKALIVAETTAGLCDEAIGWEAELSGELAKRNRLALGDGRSAEIKDARIREKRIRSRAADRFFRAWHHAEALWGPIGDGACPRIRKKDELPYLLGLFAGTVALLHDKASGSEVGVPLDQLNRIARGAVCVDTETWWHVPTALQAAAWAVIPGSGPPDVDPWEKLFLEAQAGESSGVRLAWALYTLIAANADRADDVRQGILAHAASIAATQQDPEWALLDEYARLVSLHQSDLLWIEAAGHRTDTFGILPDTAAQKPGWENPFNNDPFASDAVPEKSSAEIQPSVEEKTE